MAPSRLVPVAGIFSAASWQSIAADGDVSVQDSFLRRERTCWRSGRSFFRCCEHGLVAGNPQCWQSGDVTHQYCCKPPLANIAGAWFEDPNCELVADGERWQQLRADIRHLLEHGASCPLHGGFREWLAELDRQVSSQSATDCPLGVAAASLAKLKICLMWQESDAGTSDAFCSHRWDDVADHMRRVPADPTPWLASKWMIFNLFHLLSEHVEEGTNPACEVPELGGDGGWFDWPMFHRVARTHEPQNGPAHQVFLDLMHRTLHVDMDCWEGRLWSTLLLTKACMSSDASCTLAYEVLLQRFLLGGLFNGEALLGLVKSLKSWNMFKWWHRYLRPSMRHDFSFTLNDVEWRVTGIASDLSFVGCADLERAGVEAWHIPDGDLFKPPLSYCRAMCGRHTLVGGPTWKAFGMGWIDLFGSAQWMCVCASDEALIEEDCHNTAHVALYRMPQPVEPSTLRQQLLQLGGSAPVLSQAASVLDPELTAGPQTIFVTMVFGRMATWIAHFGRRVEALALPKVVIFALDSRAAHECAEASLRSRGRVACIRGDVRTALAKYTMVLAVLSLGHDVFWFDFDSVWLQNPLPALSDAISRHPEALLLTALDVDSVDCSMNAFFWLRAGAETFAWIVAVMAYIHRFPYVHDQLAFSMHLGTAPFINAEPVATLGAWAPLDPNKFVNAAKFQGLGFHGPVEDIVLFHFFDGWNSNQPSSSTAFVDKRFEATDFFEIMYTGNEEAVHELITASRIEPPAELRSCSHADDLGIGVETHKIQIPIVQVS